MEEILIKDDGEQNRNFPSDLASRGSRFVARLIDGFTIAAITIIPILSGAFSDNKGKQILLFFGLGFLGYFGCQIYLLTTKGQTIGKMAMKIKVVKADTGKNGGFVTNVLIRAVVNYIIAD